MSMEKQGKQFIYVLKPVDRLLNVENWTEVDEQIISRHFTYLKDLKQEGKLILAGKTVGLNEKTFGIVIFKAESLEEASKMMRQDPSVNEAIMNAEVFEYRVAITKDL